MNYQKVKSSNLEAVAWEEDRLSVVFRSGSTYLYYGVPQYIYLGLINAESKGRYLHHYVKGVYPYRRIE